MLIKVTQEHIDNGVKESATKCPVALALAEATGHCWYVGYRDCRGWVNGQVAGFQLSFDLTNFAFDFDIGIPVTPVEFEVDL